MEMPTFCSLTELRSLFYLYEIVEINTSCAKEICFKFPQEARAIRSHVTLSSILISDMVALSSLSDSIPERNIYGSPQRFLSIPHFLVRHFVPSRHLYFSQHKELHPIASMQVCTCQMFQLGFLQ